MSMPPTTMTGQLWRTCEHGEAKGHTVVLKRSEHLGIPEYQTCPGGHPVDVEDRVVKFFGGPSQVPDADEGNGSPYRVLNPQRLTDLERADLAVLLWREGHRDEDLGIMLMDLARNYAEHLRVCPGGHPVEGGRKWWCETHDAESTNQLDPSEDQLACWLYMDFPEKPDGPCRMVERFLIPPSAPKPEREEAQRPIWMDPQGGEWE